LHNGNTAEGGAALASLTTGSKNTANGTNALFDLTTATSNTATGFGALQNNNANNNTADGTNALFSNVTGTNNSANGVNALFSNTIGNSNTADGWNALRRNTTGSSNIALGFNAGTNLTTGSNNIDIGNVGVAGDANMIRIGKQGTQTSTFVAGISGSTLASGVGVIVSSTGQLGTILSSARFKTEVKSMDNASEAIHRLQPVTFRYKEELDPDGILQFGLVAEQVEKVNPDLVVRDADGKVMTVRYEAINAMLLNEFLKEHRKVEEQRAYFESKVAEQQKQIETLTAGLQKVTARVEADNSAQRIVIGN
jgi:hypothetical protein